MDFILVGVPNTGKSELIDKLVERFNMVMDDGLISNKELAMDRLADYRVELKMAVDRAHFMADQRIILNKIYSHTLIDSVAYSATRYVSMRELGIASEYDEDKWALITGAIGALFRDTFRFDHIFFLPSNDDEYEDIENALLGVLDGFGVAYTYLEGEDKLAEATGIIQRYIDDEREGSTT